MYQINMHFKQTIQISNRNVNDIFSLPCVEGVRKEFDDDVLKYRYELTSGTRSSHFILGDFIRAYAYEGDWLCEDDKGFWYTLSDKEYQNISDNQ